MGKITTKKRILFSFRGQVTINGQIMSEKPGIFCAQNGQKLWVFGQPGGEVIIKNNEDAKWVVMEYPFSQKKYEFLVSTGLCNVSVVNKFHDLYRMQSNKRRTLLFREYNRYFAR